jgi:ribosomal protein L3 glutamine methyltransferase
MATARELIQWGAARLAASDLFYGHGTQEPLGEAVYLVFSAVGREFYCADALLDQPLSEEQARRAREFILARIETRKPAAYIARQAWFAGLRFYVDERVLVPRSPIAELIETGFSPWVEEGRVDRILDIGTGSGCIAIACALAFPGARVDAVDISPQALEVARQNVEHYRLGSRVALIRSDLLAALGQQQYDLIVSNPPYVPSAEIADLPAEYLHEPALGLAGGQDGLDIVKRLLAQVPQHLTREGILVVEVGEQAQALALQYPQVPFLWLDLERGGEGVFLLEAAQVRAFFG